MSPGIHYYASALSGFLPIAAFIYRFKALNSELKILAIFLIFSVLVEALTFVEGIYRLNNMVLFNIFTLAEGFVFFYIVGKWFHSKRMFKYAMILFFVYFIYWFYTTFITANIWQ